MSPALSPRGAVARLVHPCLDPLPDGGPVAGGRLTHVQRLGVVLQAAGLLSLLARAGWGLAGWETARLGRDGRLSVTGRLGPARSLRPAQELLRDLLARLFGGSEADLRGPGPAKSAARALAERWRQSLVPLAPDDAVAQVLEAAPFLWEAAFAEERAALAGELHRFDGREESALVWVAGPRPFRRRVFAVAQELAAVQALLAGPEARRLWDREEEGDPRSLAAAGRWRAAVAAWERRPPVLEPERVERAQALAALGRFEAALGALTGLASPAALLARSEVQLRLGEQAAALAALRELKEARLSPDEAAGVAEVAARAYANSRTPEEALPWLRRALTTAGSAGSRAGLRARIAAAAAAWDRRDLETMDRLLAESRAALDDPGLAWRWHQARALWEMETADGAARAIAHAEAALRQRRLLPRHRAADLWNEAGLARAAAGDLPGAERAFLHATRLMEGCDGPRRATLALCNLAEIRLRRGRLAGVREILELSTAENRRTGNLRAQTQDAEMWARLELVLGRPEAALAACRAALAVLERQGLDWRRSELSLLAARALGWLGRTAEAAAELRDVPPGTARELEPEERPALYALAGDRGAARRELTSIPDPGQRALWAAVLAGEAPAGDAWSALGTLEPYRAARLIADLERTLPGAAPADLLRRAAAVLRHVGALPLAEALEAREGGGWRTAAALLTLLRSCPGSGAGSAPGPEAGEEQPAAAAEDRPGARRAGRSGEMAGESPVFQAALGRLDRLATGDFPILVLGESGTGKELAARRIHRASPRAAAAFVAVNCAALSETLLLSDLFGHVRGAFTGADRDRPGVFQTADGGTVFLDEIGDLPLTAQGLLLRVLQEGEVRRLGESAPRKVNIRVLAATHRDLSAMVEAKTFRLDLYHRLRVGRVELPPLRERGDDVLLLADRFLERSGMQLSREARTCLRGHSWPGNIRELQNVLSAATALAEGRIIRPEHLEIPAEGSPPAGLSYQEQIDAARRRAIFGALEACNGNQSAAARRLGLSRQGFHHVLQELGSPDHQWERPAGSGT